jgi:2-dehydropantoate 2-reductase
MKIAVLGTGGVGGYFGARLAAAKYDVTFVARGKHLDAMRKNGLRISSALGDVVVENPRAVDDVNAVGQIDLGNHEPGRKFLPSRCASRA